MFLVQPSEQATHRSGTSSPQCSMLAGFPVLSGLAPASILQPWRNCEGDGSAER
jgi:hypothetical protein